MCVNVFLCVCVVTRLGAQLMRSILAEQAAREMIKVCDGIPLLLRYTTHHTCIIRFVRLVTSLCFMFLAQQMRYETIVSLSF